jgi:hypothetical protein
MYGQNNIFIKTSGFTETRFKHHWQEMVLHALKRITAKFDCPKMILVPHFEADNVVPAGFEPTTHRLEICCSIQLSYGTNVNTGVGVGRFELPTSTSRTWRANRTTLHPVLR